MLERLLESRFKPERSVSGTIASVAGHTVLVAAALYATAQTHNIQRTPERIEHAYYVAPRHPAAVISPTRSTPAAHVATNRPIFVDVKIPEISPRAIDAGSIVARPGDFARQQGDAFGDPETPATSPDGVFRAEQVDKQVGVVPGSSPPRYPESLRVAGVEGQVIAIFVVDEQGRAEAESVRFLHSGNELFEREVTATLRAMRFIPAEAGGKKVRQLVQMPFVFKLSR
jgi:periplasmic protein TonB